MRHTVSKCTPNFREGPSFPSTLSYQSDNTPSGWQSFPVDIRPVHCRPYNPFLHLRCPTSNMLPHHISSAAVSIPVVLPLLHCACPPLYSPLTLSAIPISRVSVVVLIALYSIVPCTSLLLFVYLLRSDLLLALHRSLINCLL